MRDGFATHEYRPRLSAKVFVSQPRVMSSYVAELSNPAGGRTAIFAIEDPRNPQRLRRVYGGILKASGT
jgi:hypothetical protein